VQVQMYFLTAKNFGVALTGCFGDGEINASNQNKHSVCCCSGDSAEQ
jgi:hypothetical protein